METYHSNMARRQVLSLRLKAQYIWYLGAGLLALLILFAILYICGVNSFICLGLIMILGTALFLYVYKLSHDYGEYGMMKKMAARGIPRVIKSRTRKFFLIRNQRKNGK